MAVTERIIAPDDTGRAGRALAHPARVTSGLLLLPALVLVGPLVVGPAAVTVVGGLVADPGSLRAAVGGDETRPFVLTALWALVVPVVVAAVGLAVAALAQRRTTLAVVRPAFVAPLALPLVVTAVAFRLLYHPDPDRGMATALVDRLPGGAPPVFVSPPVWINVALMSAFVWAWVGLAAVVFRKALDRVRQSSVDYVLVRRGRWWTVVRHAYLPLLRRPTAVVLALVALATVRAFDLVVTMSPGSAVRYSSVLGVRLWQTGGEAQGLALLWLLLVLGVAAVAAAIHRRLPPVEPVEPAGVEAEEPVAPEEAEAVEAANGGAGAPRPTAGVLRRWWLRWRRRNAPVPPVRWGERRRRGWGLAPRWFGSVATVALAAGWAVPLLVLLGTSLHDRSTAATAGWWSTGGLGLESYRVALGDLPLVRSLGLTLLLAGGATGFVLLLAAPAAHALAWLGPGWDTVVSVVLLAAAVVPVLAVLEPVTDVLTWSRLQGSWLGLLVVHVAYGLPFAVLVLRNALQGLSSTVVAGAALRVGAAPTVTAQLKVLRRLVPAIRGSLAAVAVLQFVQVWNDFVVGLLFGGPDLVPGVGGGFVGEATPLALLVFGESRQVAVNSGPLAAVAVVGALVPVALVLATWRWVVDGLVPEVRS